MMTNPICHDITRVIFLRDLPDQLAGTLIILRQLWCGVSYVALEKDGVVRKRSRTVATPHN